MFIQAGIIEYIAFCYDFQKRNSKSSNPFFFFLSFRLNRAARAAVIPRDLIPG